MGLFGTNSPFDADVDKATNENNVAELWDVIMEICDKVGHSSRNSKDCLRSIVRRLGHNDPHVVVQAITLLDACINNCGKKFHLEIASRDFETEFRRLLQRSQPTVALKLKLSLKKWADSEFKSDDELNLIPSLYQKLRSEGHDFTDTGADPPKKVAPLSKDPNVVNSQKEQDDIALAIELSLKEGVGGTKATSAGATTTATGTSSSSSNSNTNPYASLYSAVANGNAATASSRLPAQQQVQAKPAEARKVRALYDFEAAEDNELTFLAGEIIHVVDDSDPNWWKGYNQRGEGLFPSNFVTADLSAEPEYLETGGSRSGGKQSTDAEAALADGAQGLSGTAAAAAGTSAAAQSAPQLVDIDEDKIDRLLHLLSEANPEDPSQDTEEMLRLEDQVNRMQPLIDTELERVDRKHAQLTQLSSDLVDAINLYHMLMREPIGAAGATVGGYGGAANGAGVGAYSGGMYHAGAAPTSPYGGAPGGVSLSHSMQSMALGPPPHSLSAQQQLNMHAAAGRYAPPPSAVMQQSHPNGAFIQSGVPHPQDFGGNNNHHQQHHQQQHQQQQQHHPSTTLANAVGPHIGVGGVGGQPLPHQAQQLPAMPPPTTIHHMAAMQQQQPQSIQTTTLASQQLPQQMNNQHHQHHHQQQQQHPHLNNQYAMLPGGAIVAPVPIATNAGIPPQQHAQQPFAAMHNGQQAGGAFYAQNFAAHPMVNNGGGPSQTQQQPQPIYQQQPMQQQYAGITQPITNTILPPADGGNIPHYQQQQAQQR